MPTMAGSLQGKMELTAEYLKLLEARAKIKLNEIQEYSMSDEARDDFADFNISVKQTLKDVDSRASHLARPVSFSFQVID